MVGFPCIPDTVATGNIGVFGVGNRELAYEISESRQFGQGVSFWNSHQVDEAWSALLFPHFNKR